MAWSHKVGSTPAGGCGRVDHKIILYDHYVVCLELIKVLDRNVFLLLLVVSVLINFNDTFGTISGRVVNNAQLLLASSQSYPNGSIISILS